MNIKYILTFIGGVVVGSAATLLYFKKYYTVIDEDSNESKSEDNDISNCKKSAEGKIEKTFNDLPDISVYEDVLKKNNYKAYSKEDDVKEENLPSEDDNPFIYFINDDEVGHTYESEYLEYYVPSDVIVNEYGKRLEEDEFGEMIGIDWRERMINDDPLELYVRNVYLEKDYTITPMFCPYDEE